MKQILHYPQLDTVLMVEKTLKEADDLLSKNELSRRLPKQVMRQTLNVILDYLQERNMILIGRKGIHWIWNDSPKMKKLIEESVDAREYFRSIGEPLPEPVRAANKRKRKR